MPFLNNPHCGFSWIFFFFSVFFFFSFSLSDPRISNPHLYCGTDLIVNSTQFATNFLKEFELISKLVRAQRFTAHTFGVFPVIYTLVNCMEDLSEEDCILCYAEGRVKIPRCYPKSSGRIFLDGCFLRYDNYSFFEESVDPKQDKVVCDSGSPLSSDDDDDENFSSKVDQVVNKVKDVALNNSGFGVAEVRGGRFSVYALAQCWKTVSDHNCEECLVKAASGAKGCAPKKEGRGLNVGCYLRYSTHKFYNDTNNSQAFFMRKTARRRWLIWVLAIVPVVLAILIVSIFIWFCRRRRGRRRQKLLQRGNKDQSEDLLLFDLDFSIESNNGENGDGNKLGTVGKKEVDNMPLFSFTSVSAATDNFSAANKLGEGGFGPVYKGKLLKGQEVAAKRLSKRSGQGLEELRNEVVLIAKLQHKYLVRLLGCCIEGEEKILIYEYMPNRSLDTFLFDPIRGRELDWERRIHIVDGIAQGLLYLHQYSRLRIIHRDLKASNILLDGEMNPKISDFGLARIFGGNQSEANTARIVGTYGYMSPEYAMEGHFSIKSDVFSFGVLLLEIISGKKNTGFYLSDCLNLLGYAWELWKNDRLVELMDSRLGDASSSFTSVLFRYIHVAFLCVQESAADRPTMSDVCSMLKDELSTLPSFKQPAFSTGRSVMDGSLHARKTIIHTVNDLTVSNIEGR